MKIITIVSNCYNEAGNIRELVDRVSHEMEFFLSYTWEMILIDNASSDGTREVLRRLASADRRIKVILNVRNFGHIRSPVHALRQATGDAVIYMASDLQDPPEIIREFIPRWESGYKIVAAVKNESRESALFFQVRKLYYHLTALMANTRLIKNWTGFGLFDQCVIQHLRNADDPYPYIRGFFAELGYAVAEVPFVQPSRARGFTKNNFYTLYDIGMLGVTAHTKIPLRIATLLGFALGGLSLLASLAYLVYKMLFWNRFGAGVAPLVIGIFFLGSVQLFFIGIVGEYVGAILTKLEKRPMVVEEERINF